MTRYVFIERTLRQIYGGFPSDDSQITFNLANQWLIDGTAIAAKQNYRDNIMVDGIQYVNNSFYTTFKGLTASRDESFLWKVLLPSIPLGIGSSDGISTMIFKDENGLLSFPVVMMSQNQRSVQRGMRTIPNKVLAYPEGNYVYVLTTLNLSGYTASITMISAGDETNLDSELILPPDYFPIIVEYMQKQLMAQRAAPVDTQNDGLDAIKST